MYLGNQIPSASNLGLHLKRGCGFQKCVEAAGPLQLTHRPQSSSFLGLPYRILLWVGTALRDGQTALVMTQAGEVVGNLSALIIGRVA